jgi:hypothetical protein
MRTRHRLALDVVTLTSALRRLDVATLTSVLCRLDVATVTCATCTFLHRLAQFLLRHLILL